MDDQTEVEEPKRCAKHCLGSLKFWDGTLERWKGGCFHCQIELVGSLI